MCTFRLQIQALVDVRDAYLAIPEMSGTRVNLIYRETLKFKKESGRDAGFPRPPLLNVVDDSQELNRAISGFGGSLFFSGAIQTRHLDVPTSSRRQDRWP
jgi:hypothetical protein